jgi:hypothetical protein
MMKLETELLQEQEEEGGDRRNQPVHNVRIEEDEFPCGKVAERDLAGPDFPDVRRRGPPQKAPHRVQLFLALEAARERKRGHGDFWGELRRSKEERSAERKEADREKGCGDEGALRRPLLARAKR